MAESKVLKETRSEDFMQDVLMNEGRGNYTVRDYRKLPEGAPFQLIEGRLVYMPAPKPKHQRVVRNTAFFLCEKFGDKGEVLFAPVDVYLTERNAFQPDVVFILKGKDIVKEDGIYGAPDLVVEVLSPSTGYWDLTRKKEVYERVGVSEYWIIDPERETFEVYVNEGGRFRLFSEGRGKDTVKSKLLDSEIKLSDIF